VMIVALTKLSRQLAVLSPSDTGLVHLISDIWYINRWVSMRCRDLPALLACPLKSSCRKHFCSVINQSKCKLSSVLCSSSGSYRAYLSSNFMMQPPSKSSSSNTSNNSYSFNITNSIPTSCNQVVSISVKILSAGWELVKERVRSLSIFIAWVWLVCWYFHCHCCLVWKSSQLATHYIVGS
jgi:hypothetical protein